LADHHQTGWVGIFGEYDRAMKRAVGCLSGYQVAQVWRGNFYAELVWCKDFPIALTHLASLSKFCL
jgi:hypothetical protein